MTEAVTNGGEYGLHIRWENPFGFKDSVEESAHGRKTIHVSIVRSDCSDGRSGFRQFPAIDDI
jgi:hypothetical protein